MLIVPDLLLSTVDRAREKANQHGERFNIFSILRMNRDESKTHSRFLYELLNPQGRHGEGDAFLHLFLETVLELNAPLGDRYRVMRELATERNRRVDIVVESRDFIAGIELKIDAADQPAQLHDYYQELQQCSGNRKSVTLAYLTLDGKGPSAMSLNKLDGDEVSCISYEEHISGWLQACIDRSLHKPIVPHAIQQYQQLIQNLTGAGGTMNDPIAGEMSSDIEKFKAALEVEKSLPKAKAAVQEMFWRQLSEALEAQFGSTPTIYGGKNIASMSASYFMKSKNNKHIGFRMPICKADDEQVVCLYVNLYQAVHYGLRVENSSGAVVSSPELRKVFRKELGNGNAVADKDADWLVCFYYNPAEGDNEKMIDFYSFNSAAIGLLDEQMRESLIEDMAYHLQELSNEAKKPFEGRSKVDT